MLDEFWLDMFGSYMSLASLRPGLDQKSRGLSGGGELKFCFPSANLR